MNQAERRNYLIQYLLGENPDYQTIEIPQNAEEQKQLLRSLFNLRPPQPVPAEFLAVQDEYLSTEVRMRGIVDSRQLTLAAADPRLFLWQGDITRLKVDAIVNAANSGLLGCFQPCHSCIDNIIHTTSGVQLRLKCSEIMQAQGHEEETGTAKIHPGTICPASMYCIRSGRLLLESCRREIVSC